MYYKRNESYRFVFNQPVPGKLTKSEKADRKITTDVHILDVSNQGARLYCHNQISLKENSTIFLSFQLNNTSFQATGIIKWIKQYPESAELGVRLSTDEAYQENMKQELKQIAREKHK